MTQVTNNQYIINIFEADSKTAVEPLNALFHTCFGAPNVNKYFEKKSASSTSIVLYTENFEGFAVGWKLNENSFFVDSLAVDKAFRGRGVGKELLIKIASIAAERFGVTSIALNVEPGNSAAIRLYKKNGYQTLFESEVMNMMAKSLDGSELPSHMDILIATFNPD